MSKSTKVIASLGVVAALGVGIMPIAGVSAGTVTHDVKGDVTVKYTVPEYITMQIENGTTADPSTEGANKGTATPESATDVQLTTKVLDTKDDLAANGNDSSYNSAIYVGTNAATGYTLSVASTANGKSTATAELFNGQSGVIPAFGAKVTDLTDSSLAATGGWGLKIASAQDKHTSSGTYADITIGSSSTPAADAYYSEFAKDGWNGSSTSAKSVLKTGTLSSVVMDHVVINYGVRASETQPAGTYQNTLTYTAHVN